jgi:ketosteroid isomerase-like protein
MYLRLRVSGVLFFAATVMPHSFGCVATQRADLREADIAMATVHSAKDFSRVASFMAEDTVAFPPNSTAISGKDAVMEYWSKGYTNSGFAVTCNFQEVGVARSEDLGYTIGTYELTLHDDDGKPMTDRGRYLTVWKNQAGEWKLLVDIWNSSEPRTIP